MMEVGAGEGDIVIVAEGFAVGAAVVLLIGEMVGGLGATNVVTQPENDETGK